MRERQIVTPAERNKNKYNFKVWQELGWGIVVALIVSIAQVFLEFDAAAVTDWNLWLLALVSGCARSVAVIVVKTFTEDIVFSKE